MARIAKSLEILRSECNALAPKRSKKYDGWIGDAAHQARASRHNPNSRGVVTALDITHDPKNGMDAHRLARLLTKNPHPDLYYIISNGESAYRSSGWVWKKYNGSNPHTGHMHVAVGRGPDSNPVAPYDDIIPWNVKDLMNSSIPVTNVDLYTWIDKIILKPRGSELSGEMLRQMFNNYGIKPLWALVITGAETSCGRKMLPDNSGPQRIVTEAHNYGCIKYGDLTSKWGQLAIPNEPFTTSDGRKFFKFPTIWHGVAALGRLLKVGPPKDPGGYLRMLKADDWRAFAEVYYGKNVPGFEEYYANLIKIKNAFQAKAKSAGLTL